MVVVISFMDNFTNQLKMLSQKSALETKLQQKHFFQVGINRYLNYTDKLITSR
jgi:hypothetical protein